MTDPAPAPQLSTAAAWLRLNPAVGDRVRGRAAVPGRAMPDAMLEDPTRLVDLVKEALVEAIRADAPVGVVEEILPALRILSSGAKGFDRYGYVATQLSALQGLRDRPEIAAALGESAANAPDEMNRASIERLRSVTNAVSVSDEHVPGPDVILGPDDVGDGHVHPEFVPSGGTGTDVGGSVPSGGTGTDSGGESPRGGTTDTSAAGTTADLGAQLGAQIGGYLAGPAGAEIGAQIGAEIAPEFDPFEGSSAAQFGASVGSRVGSQLCGEDCAQIGASIGGFIGGQLGSHGVGTPGLLNSITDAVTCALCGPSCIPCVLAAESMGAWVDQVLHL
jgi:hypothetical protein